MPSFVDSNTTGSGFGGWNTGGGYGWDGGGGTGGGTGSIWADLIPLLGSAAGSYFQADAAKDASRAGQEGAAAGIAEQRRQFDLIMQMLAPQRGLGDQASNALARLYGFQPTQGTTGMVPTGTPNAANPMAAPSAAYAGQTSEQIKRSLYDNGFTQDGVNALYASRGMQAPTLPSGLTNQRVVNTRGGPRIRDAGAGIPDKESRDFLNTFGQQMVDPYREQSGVSRVAGGILDIASMALPAVGLFRAGADLGNNALGNNDRAGMAPPLTPIQQQPGMAAAAAPSGPMGLDGFFASPDYNFRRGEGMRGIENSFAARGGAASGNALRALTDFNSNLASGEFGNHVNRLLAMAGQGQASTSQGVNAAQYTGGNVANLLGQQAQARESGIINRSNAVTGGLNDLASFYGYWNRNRGN